MVSPSCMAAGSGSKSRLASSESGFGPSTTTQKLTSETSNLDRLTLADGWNGTSAWMLTDCFER